MSKTRLHTIDALRGIGASSVMVYHLSGNLKEFDWAPTFIDVILSYGYLGVPLFFVISGFVIAQSTNKASLSVGFLGLFAAKRSIRLDPAYWSMLLLILALALVKSTLFPEENTVYPTVASFLAHVVYLQDLLGYPPMSPVLWTLCLEIQFYLFFIASRLLFEHAFGSRNALHLWLFGAFLGSLAIHQELIQNPVPGLFLKYWYLFYFGVIANWALYGDVPLRRLTVILVIATLALLLEPASYLVTGILTTALVVQLGRLGRLDSFLVNPFLLYLGTISYSLYLIHPEVGWSAISVCRKLIGGAETGDLMGLAYFAIGCAVSVVSAHIFWRLIEAPSNAIASSLGRRPATTPPAADAVR